MGAVDQERQAGSPETVQRGRWLRSGRGRRRLALLVHLVAAALVGTFVYAPAVVTGPMRLPLQIAAVPLVAFTGVFLCRQAGLERLVRQQLGR